MFLDEKEEVETSREIQIKKIINTLKKMLERSEEGEEGEEREEGEKEMIKKIISLKTEEKEKVDKVEILELLQKIIQFKKVKKNILLLEKQKARNELGLIESINKISDQNYFPVIENNYPINIKKKKKKSVERI